jgi:hypothetical protein
MPGPRRRPGRPGPVPAWPGGAPRRPGRQSAGTRQSSSSTSAVWEARMPSLRSFLPWRSRGVPGGTTKLAWPRWPRVGSTVATTTWTLAMPPLVMNTFWPFRTQSSPSRTARVRRLETSEPAPGSVTANAPHLGLGRGAEQLGGPAGTWPGVPLAMRATRAARCRRCPARCRRSPSRAPRPAGAGGCRSRPRRPSGRSPCRTADVGRLGDDRPGELLGLVVVGRDRPDLLLGELACPLLRGHLVFGEGKADHGQVLSRTA